jgi:hypothetical protein
MMTICSLVLFAYNISYSSKKTKEINSKVSESLVLLFIFK